MRSIFVIIADAIGEQPLQMLFVERDHMVEQIASAALDPSLRNAVLPRALVRCPHRIDLHRSYGNWDLRAVFGVPVENEEAGSRVEWESLPELLDDPHARRMFGDVEVQNAPSVVPDNEEAVENAERDRRDRKEVHGSNRLPMVPQKT
jgi:hypothetical protein